MPELERALETIGRELDFPATPELGGPVRARIERRSQWRRAVLVAVAVLLVAFGIALAVPDARSAILRFFHIGSVTVEQVETLPPARERPLVAGLGPPRSRRDAEVSAHLPIVLPKNLEGPPPRRFYAQPGVIAVLLSVEGKPVLLAEMRDDQVSIVKKLASGKTKVEPAGVGEYGLWLEGGDHVLTWQFGLADTRQIRTRLAGNVLIWLKSGRTFRLEGALSKEKMQALARDITL
jgi:hypothetical protein